jgi:hypothetical protein
VNAHYIIQRKEKFWLLSRGDRGRDLAFFPSKQQAIGRAEVLAHDAMPSQLDIHHESGRLETRHYPKLQHQKSVETAPLHEHVL